MNTGTTIYRLPLVRPPGLPLSERTARRSVPTTESNIVSRVVSRAGPRRCCRSNSAFTLIELLVVITIITTLAALLMPALKAAKDRAKTTTCTSNLRQIGTALNFFLADHDQLFPYAAPWRYPYYLGTPSYPYSGPVIAGIPWHRQLGPYVGGTNSVVAARLFYCPSNPWPVPLTTTLAGGSPTLYGLNGQIIPGNWHDSSGVDPVLSPGHYIGRTKATRLQSPSGAMLTGENPYANPGDNLSLGLTLPQGSISYLHFTYGYTNNWRSPWFGKAAAWGDSHPQEIVMHNLSWNSLMGDGHVQLISKDTLIKEMNTAASQLWNGGITVLNFVTDLNDPYPQ